MAIPVAFEVAAESAQEVGSRTRRAIRDKVNKIGLLQRCVEDIKDLLLPEGGADPTGEDMDRVTLQSGHGIEVASGRNYADDIHSTPISGGRRGDLVTVSS